MIQGNTKIIDNILEFKDCPVLCVVDSIPGDFPNHQRVELSPAERPLVLAGAYNSNFPPGGVLPDHRVVSTTFVDTITGVITIPADAGTEMRASIHMGPNEVVMNYINVDGEKIALVQRHFTGESFPAIGRKSKRKDTPAQQNYLNLRKGWNR